jgi:MFS family permease
MKTKTHKRKPRPTTFLKAVVWFLGLAVLALCALALPAGIRAEHAGGYRPLLIGMYVPAIPFYIGMYHTLRLLRNTDISQAFSADSIRSLKMIKYCGLAIGLLYGAAMPYIYLLADRDDAPGVVLIGLMFTFGPLAIAVCAAILQQLLQNAIAIKSENELTV